MSRGPDDSRGLPVVELQFDRPDRRYAPGERLEARYRVGGMEATTVRALESSVAWYTEGKGEEDLVVQAFARLVDPKLVRAAIADGRVDVVLPASPLSYEGVIVKIRWCVRIRVFFGGGREFVSEHVFDLGAVPPARPAAEEPEA